MSKNVIKYNYKAKVHRNVEKDADLPVVEVLYTVQTVLVLDRAAKKL